MQTKLPGMSSIVMVCAFFFLSFDGTIIEKKVIGMWSIQHDAIEVKDAAAV